MTVPAPDPARPSESQAPPVPTAPAGPQFTPEELQDVQDAVDQDKELRWLERDASIAERALLDAPAGTKADRLKTLHRAHLEAQQRLTAAHEAILSWLEPQFAKRRQARLRGDDAVVFTREEFRVLSLTERDRLDQPGRDHLRIAAELKEQARATLEARGWKPAQRAKPGGTKGRAPATHHAAWKFRERLDRLFDGAA